MFRSRAVAIGFGVAFFLSGSVACSQTKPTLQVLVEDLPPDAQICGVNESSVKSISALTLRNNGIQAAASSTNPYLYVNITATRVVQGDRVLGCAVYYDVSVRGSVPNTLRDFKARESTFSAILICRSSRLVVESVSTVASSVTRRIEEEIKLCLGKLEY
jgi:hypothetical protein